MRNVFIVGDSISIHYSDYLQKLSTSTVTFQHKPGTYEIDNPKDINSQNAGNSANVLEYFKQEINNGKKYDAILLNCGLHDIRRSSDQLSIAVTLDEYCNNLKEILRILKGNYNILLWASSTPVDDKRHNLLRNDFKRFNKDIIEYNNYARNIMIDAGAVFVDLNLFTCDYIDSGYIDHIHFNHDVRAKQAKFLADFILKIL